MYCDPAPDFVVVSVAPALLEDDGPALVTVPFVVPLVELP